ncbi:MAG: nicotinate-nucleotide pyrophosphorylase (carboxylating) [Cognaticolwellia sp.]|jgi:nicotinate-nucleotide pyrophosphorylase (carboxylating)
MIENQIQKFIKEALYEDVRDGDHTSLACVPSNKRDRAKLLVKDDGILAGVDLAKYIFRYVDATSTIDVLIKDGSPIKYGDVAFEVECNSQDLLKAERLVLNTMQRMSGIATLSNQFAEKVKDLPIQILDTRKTTPLIRFLEKWAVRIGGCTNYRDGLYDWIMIKDNHVDAAGGMRQALERVHAYQKENDLELGITVEVRNFEEMDMALEIGGMTRIMLDNFELEDMRRAVKIINKRFEVEASGGITLKTVRPIAETGVDFISSGALTHSSKSLDLSLKIIK